MMPLTFAKINETLSIKKVMTTSARSHLKDLGFVEGENISIVQKGNAGLIVLVKGVRLALSLELASRIYVSEGDQNEA